MRPFKLGLSKPKSKKKSKTERNNEQLNSNTNDISEIDEINASRDTLDSLSDLHLKRTIKKEFPSDSNNSKDIKNESTITNDSITDLVNKFSIKQEINTDAGAAKTYDLMKEYEPTAGPSKTNRVNTEYCATNYSNNFFSNSLNESLESSPEDTCNKLGIVSFYDKSKLFDLSESDTDKDASFHKSIYDHSINQGQHMSIVEKNDNSDTKAQKDLRKRQMTPDIISSYSISPSKVLTPRIRPPSKNYIISSLDKYNIPKVKNPEPYFSDHKDVGDKVEIGQMVLKLQSKLSRDQKPFEKVLDTTSIEEWRQLMFLQTNETSEEAATPDALKILLAGNRQCVMEPIARPPTKRQVLIWLKKKVEPVSEPEENKVNHKEISKNIDELDHSQALGLNEDEVNNSVSIEMMDKVRVTTQIIVI